MTATARRPKWPDIAWSAPALRDLDRRARAEVEAAGQLRSLVAHQPLFAVGDPADALCVVVDGEVEVLAIARGDNAASVLRRVRPGEIFGEDAALWDFGARRHAARARSEARVAMIPVGVLRRALTRADATQAAERLERGLRRVASLDLLRGTALGAADAAHLEALVDASEHVRLNRSEVLFRAGDPVDAVYIVGDGMVMLKSDGAASPRAEAYVTRLDVVGDDSLALAASRRLTAVASGPTWLLALPRASLSASDVRDLTGGVKRVRTEALDLPRPGAHTTAHVFEDVYRLDVARSLLVIDQDSCVRCGHCTWSCAAEHSDGVARIVRRGDKIVVGHGKTRLPLLLPNSCQHCKNPSCMVDCPTGAIGRDARGEVFIREELCTGCGNCAKGCPWENIQIAPRAATKAVPFTEVAVKCDLCSGRAGGPACVSACPVGAIARIEPAAAAVVAPAGRRGAEGVAPRVVPAPTPAWGWALGGLLGALALSRVRPGPWESGALLGVLLALALAYAVGKRLVRRVPARPQYAAHLAIGSLFAGAIAAHGALRPSPSAAFALTIAALAASVTGIAAALAYVALPSRVARLERRGLLPEDVHAASRSLDDRVFSTLSGRSELVKTLFARVLRAELRSRASRALLLLSGRSVGAEERRLRARVDALREGRGAADLAGLDELVTLVAERRALDVARVLRAALRALVVVHVSATGATLALTIVHLVHVLRGRG
ncbi:MAG: cyclic nucleotide-binding domain-containing protein [Polyangiaceae bacterium]